MIDYSTVKFKCHQKTLISIITEYIGNPRKGAEIGVWVGRTSRRLLTAFENLHLYMVDSYKDENKFRLNDEYTMGTALLEAYEGTYEWAERRTLIIQHSLEAASLFKERSLDFCFIDAAHDYTSVKNDIDQWAPKVREDGLIIGHDYGSRLDEKGKFGVKRASNEYAKASHRPLRTAPGFIWFIVR